MKHQCGNNNGLQGDKVRENIEYKLIIFVSFSYLKVSIVWLTMHYVAYLKKKQCNDGCIYVLKYVFHMKKII